MSTYVLWTEPYQVGWMSIAAAFDEAFCADESMTMAGNFIGEPLARPFQLRQQKLSRDRQVESVYPWTT